MGVDFVNEPTDSSKYKATYEVFDKVNKGQKFNLKLKFYDKKFPIINPDSDNEYVSGGEAGGVWYAKDRQIDILTDSDDNLYKFRLMHEYGHALGIGSKDDDEFLADAFANQYYPDIAFYPNNPYVKKSWKEGYIPPNPQRTPKFPFNK